MMVFYKQAVVLSLALLALLRTTKQAHALLTGRPPPLRRPSTVPRSGTSPSRRRPALPSRRPAPPRAVAPRAAAEAAPSAAAPAVPLPLVLGVGASAALLGHLYARCLSAGFRLLWRRLPAALLGGGAGAGAGGPGALLRRHPAAYLPLAMTGGGLAVALLSTACVPQLFSAHDFVHVLSDSDPDKMERFPGARKHLLPVLLLSLLTSISGFSLGPEGPMVTAGGLLGVSLARKYYRASSAEGAGPRSTAAAEETLAYAGAAGTITGFMNVPLAGPLFALEMTSRGPGVSPAAARSTGAAVAACLAGHVVVRGAVVPRLGLGGHFAYGAGAAVGAVTGREMVLVGLGCGAGGAVVGTVFHGTLRRLKAALWPAKTAPSTAREKGAAVAKKTLVAAALGLLSLLYPQTMFWGEGSLQCVVDGQCTPFAATPHGLPAALTRFARVNPNLPFASGAAALQVGGAKFAAILLASAGGFPGGVIFPLLSNGASLAHALVAALRPLLPAAASSLVPPLMVMSLMAATLTSVTRTPLATVLILALTASATTPLSALLPGVLLASYVSVWVSKLLSGESFFSYTE